MLSKFCAGVEVGLLLRTDKQMPILMAATSEGSDEKDPEDKLQEYVESSRVPQVLVGKEHSFNNILYGIL